MFPFSRRSTSTRCSRFGSDRSRVVCMTVAKIRNTSRRALAAVSRHSTDQPRAGSRIARTPRRPGRPRRAPAFLPEDPIATVHGNAGRPPVLSFGVDVVMRVISKSDRPFGVSHSGPEASRSPDSCRTQPVRRQPLFVRGHSRVSEGSQISAPRQRYELRVAADDAAARHRGPPDPPDPGILHARQRA